MPKAENTLIAAVLKRVFCYAQKVWLFFYPLVALENSPTETSVVHFLLKSQHFPTAIKWRYFRNAIKSHRILQTL